jgi:hypothetical protein
MITRDSGRDCSKPMLANGKSDIFAKVTAVCHVSTVRSSSHQLVPGHSGRAWSSQCCRFSGPLPPPINSLKNDGEHDHRGRYEDEPSNPC